MSPSVPPPIHLLLASLLLWGSGGCSSLEEGRPAPPRDYVPPVLLSVPEPGPLLQDREGTQGLGDAARRLRAQLQSFVDTVATGRGSYPAARCCAGELSHLLMQAQRWESGAPSGAGMVPILMRLATEPGMDVAPLLADSVVERATAPR